MFTLFKEQMTIMSNKRLKTILSIINLIIVVSVIVVAFVFRKQIEEFSATGYLGVFVACFAATSTILLPAPGIFVVLQYAQILSPVLVVIIGGIGTAAGEMIGYLFGRSGNDIVHIDTNKKVFNAFSKHPLLFVFIFSIIPLPIFDFVGVCSGMTRVNPIKFFLACLLGKTIKMSLFVLLYNHAKSIIASWI